MPTAELERPDGAGSLFRVDQRASREVGRAAECCVPNRSATHWVHCGAVPGAVSILRRVLPDPIVPRILRNGFILSCPASPSEFLRLTSRLALSGLPVLLGFGALLACPRRRLRLGLVTPVAGIAAPSTSPACAGSAAKAHPLSLRSVLRFSQPRDGLFRFRVCGLVASRYHLQGSVRPGVSPDSQPGLTRRQSVPPCRCCPPTDRLPLHPRRDPALCGRHLGADRLRGFAPRTEAFFEAGV